MRWLQNARGWPGARSLRRVAIAVAIVAAMVGIPAIGFVAPPMFDD